MVEGFGIYERGEFKGAENEKSTAEYRLWNNMLSRCYNAKKLEMSPSYVGCSVANEFRAFQDFMKWATKQVGYGSGSQLDKDLLIKGNKIYSPENCIFVPPEVNYLLPNCRAARGAYPPGVDAYRGGFRASLREGAKRRYLGVYATPEEAFVAYKKAKETHIALVAEKYKEVLDPRAYVALQCYQVEATD